MKYYLLIFWLLFGCFVTVNAQQDIQVASFKQLTTDLDGRTASVKDRNGKLAALIKVTTTEKGFTFDVGKMGLAGGPIQKEGEIWIYVSPGTQKITIKHEKFMTLREYSLDIPITSSNVYELRLITGKIRTLVEEEADGQYWVLKVSPPDAVVTVDEGSTEILTNGVLSKFLPYGKHTYSISAPLYQPTGGSIEIGMDRIETNISLKPAFGFLHITTEPESGSDIYIDNNLVGKSPLITDRLAEGPHQLRVMRTMFEPIEQSVIVPTGGDTLACPVVLSANFANVIVTTAEDAVIYINDENHGRGKWSGRLLAGHYKIEARKPSHRTVLKSIEVKKGEQQPIQLNAPEPIYGKIQIGCGNVADVNVVIDGKLLGKAPDIFNDILIGKHSVEMRKEGYKTYTRELLVEEGKLHKIDHELEKELYGNLTVSTTEGATLAIDGEIYNSNRFDGKVKSGEHEIIIKYSTYSAIYKKITVKPGVDNRYDFPLEGKLSIKTQPNGASIYVDNSYKGDAPQEITLLGRHTIELKKGEDYFPYSTSEDIAPCSEIERPYELRKRPNKFYTFLMYVASPTSYTGGMVGVCRSWGWYAKAQINKSNDPDFNTAITESGYNSNYGYEEKGHSLMNITTGPMVRITKWLFAYAGAGYGEYGRTFTLTNQNGDPIDSNFMAGKTKGISVEGGLILRWKFLAISGGFGTILGDVPSYEKRYSDVHVGLGFAF